MDYFGPAGLSRGRIHPSLKAYIDCFLSPPFPKSYPRGGGVWDQDPILMRDFRAIRNFDLKWKESQEQISDAQSQMGMSSGGGEAGLGGALGDYLEELGEDGFF